MPPGILRIAQFESLPEVTHALHSGSVLSGSSGNSGGGLNTPQSVSIDGSGNTWVANFESNIVTELSSTGAILSPSSGFSGTFSNPQCVAVDGSGNVWVANLSATGNNGSITELIGAGTPVITPIISGLPLIPTLDGSSDLGTRP